MSNFFFSLGENQALLLWLSENLPMKGFLSKGVMLKHGGLLPATPGTPQEQGPRKVCVCLIFLIFIFSSSFLIINI